MTSSAAVPSASDLRVAAVDCGTNSLRLLVADLDPAAGTLTDLHRSMEVVRLGQGVDRTGRIAPEALERTLDATARAAEVCRELGVSRVRFVATSASRDASNKDDFFAGVQQRLGVLPEVVSGTEEAELSFRGATSVVAGRFDAPYLVVDLGGGSTELVLGGESDGEVEAGTGLAAFSMDVGCVRMTERHLHDDPPTAEQVAAARADVAAALDEALATVPVGRAATLVGLAGTVTTITAHVLRLERYDRDRINGASLPVDDVLRACDELLAMSREDRAALPFMHPGRVDVIGAGALVWASVVRRVRDEVAAAGGELTHVVTSEHDILDGIAWSLA
ncbi:Ppx/GppA phosphatase family protein [Luteimicrobium subarcticum]|uniref:Ppx/GppA phosphatase n=1 Tax=Luteimicrobium subarcticum TaxID=620910 RepID=A0A2M8WT62_9MICO|nr:Ppx/GppA phosphatase family protein [Luteimicrobium subarcticum]PJI94137.1 Ppx/GppA phosphatase [Luteimicrobium subarcticum]